MVCGRSKNRTPRLPVQVCGGELNEPLEKPLSFAEGKGVDDFVDKPGSNVCVNAEKVFGEAKLRGKHAVAVSNECPSVAGAGLLSDFVVHHRAFRVKGVAS